MSGAEQCIVTHRDGKVYGVYGPYRTLLLAALARETIVELIAGNDIGPNAALICPLSDPFALPLPAGSNHLPHHMEATC